MVSRLVLLAVLPLALCAETSSKPGEREAGLPFLRNYSPQEYSAQSQNWAVTQDQRGVIYVGNNDGVLVYDGVRWQTIRVKNVPCRVQPPFNWGHGILSAYYPHVTRSPLPRAPKGR